MKSLVTPGAKALLVTKSQVSWRQSAGRNEFCGVTAGVVHQSNEVEHHLWPAMSFVHLRQASQILKNTCQEFLSESEA